MAGNHYDFLTTWQVPGTCQEVYEVLSDGDGLVRWWPSVYLEVKTTRPGAQSGVGKVMNLYTKGWLPYTLRWDFEVVETNPPHGFTLKAHGDFEGTGTWTFAQEGDQVRMTYDWRIDAEKPLLKVLTPILKPIFSANHRWAMARGEESLKLELRRRHARSGAERDAVPAPPAPTFR
jgi:uncharacterized protein YndB with AHSA1/START domain